MLSIYPQTGSYVDSGTVHTGATTMAGYTSSSMEKSSEYDEDEDEGQLMLPDFDPSQAYLSLGLTPLSQLSPDANTSSDFGFFPSMPPPVAPSTSSLFSTSGSSSSTLAMDNPFSLHSGHSNSGIIDSSMMPDAYPDRRSRKSKYDNQPLSQGFPLKLEPVIEQSPANSQFSGKQNGLTSSGESSQGSPSLSIEPVNAKMMFPTAMPSQEFSRLSQGRTALRVKRPGMKGGSRENVNITSTRGNMGSYGSLGVSSGLAKTKQQLHYSPSREAKMNRRQTRENELAQQKEALRKKMEQEEMEQQRQQQEQRIGQRAREYHQSRGNADTHYSLTNGTDSHDMTNGHGDLDRESSRYEAVQMQKLSRGHQGRQVHSTSSSNGSQSEDSSPHKWTPRHSRHSSLDETPMGSHRPERSGSTHLYTTYEHR